MDRKLLVLLAVAIFGLGFAVSADNEVADVEKAAPATTEIDPGKPVDPVKTESSALNTSLLYISNRFLDLFDIVTIDIGAGAEFGVDAKITHWFQVGGMYGDKYFLGKDYARQLGGGYASGWNYGFLCLASERRFVDGTFGTTREFLLKKKTLGLAMPKEDFTYAQDIRDFWEMGVNAGWLVTVNIAIHPIELADFFAGFALIDLKGDYYGSAPSAEKAKDEKK
ncbi:MAG: hypothetical protein WCP55_03175 [Lentisphaerota bacterium]